MGLFKFLTRFHSARLFLDWCGWRWPCSVFHHPTLSPPRSSYVSQDLPLKVEAKEFVWYISALKIQKKRFQWQTAWLCQAQWGQTPPFHVSQVEPAFSILVYPSLPIPWPSCFIKGFPEYIVKCWSLVGPSMAYTWKNLNEKKLKSVKVKGQIKKEKLKRNEKWKKTGKKKK